MLASALRWIGRVASLAVLAFIGVSMSEPSRAPTAVQLIGLAFFPGIVGVGLVLAWWREGIGALLATVGLLGFYGWSVVSSAHFARGPWFVICWSPALFFAASRLLRRRPEDQLPRLS
jgi:hypothetical protein